MAELSSVLHRVKDIPIGFLADAIHVASDNGYSEEALLNKFHLAPEKLNDVGNRVTAVEYYELLDYLLEQGKIPGLGLLQASAEKLSDHGMLGTAMVSSENLRQAAEVSVKFQHLFGVPTEFYFDDRANETAFGCFGADNSLRRRWSVENVLAGWANIIRLCLGDRAVFSEVRLSYPDPGYREHYETVFNCSVIFDADRNELCTPKTLLEIPFAGANTALRNLCVKQCQQALDSQLPGRELVDQIEGLVLSTSGALPKLDAVADMLMMSPRTLHRRLDAQKTSYRKIVERLRKRMAEEYLGETTLEPKRVGYLLGYSEPANFYHAFQRWFGCTPLQYRKQYLASSQPLVG